MVYPKFELVRCLLSWRHHWQRNDVLETALLQPVEHFRKTLFRLPLLRFHSMGPGTAMQ